MFGGRGAAGKCNGVGFIPIIRFLVAGWLYAPLGVQPHHVLPAGTQIGGEIDATYLSNRVETMSFLSLMKWTDHSHRFHFEFFCFLCRLLIFCQILSFSCSRYVPLEYQGRYVTRSVIWLARHLVDQPVVRKGKKKKHWKATGTTGRWRKENKVGRRPLCGKKKKLNEPNKRRDIDETENERGKPQFLFCCLWRLLTCSLLTYR